MDTILSLETPPDIAYARVLTCAAETLAKARGLAPRETMRFQLVVEEFFGYLAAVVPDQGPVRTRLTGKAHQVGASIRFTASGLCLGALNACRPRGGPESGQDLNLVLAGRMADRFRIDHEGGDCFTLHAEVDKVYPPFEAGPGRVALRAPYRAALEEDPGILMQAAALAAARYQARHCPSSFATPAKFADLAGEGHFRCVAALDAASHPAGLMCWTRSGEKGLAFSGPFVFVPGVDAPLVARMLTDTFLSAVAREKADIVFSERATPDAPPGSFESLGSLLLSGPGGPAEQPVLYRHLREDPGETVWSAPETVDFLREAYHRLAMCRDVLAAHPPASHQRERSLLATSLDRGKGLAVLRPLLDGADAAGNLAAHARELADKGAPDVLLYLDLSRPWEAAMAGPAMAAGFTPRLVLPFAGRSDVMVLQHAAA